MIRFLFESEQQIEKLRGSSWLARNTTYDNAGICNQKQDDSGVDQKW